MPENPRPAGHDTDKGQVPRPRSSSQSESVQSPNSVIDVASAAGHDVDHDRTSVRPPPTELAEVITAAFPTSRPATRETLVSKALIRETRPGEILARQGEKHVIGLVIQGFVGIMRMTVDGRILMPNVVRASQMCQITPLAHRAAVGDLVALSTGSVALWPSESVRRLAADDAGLALDMVDHALIAFESVIEGVDGLLHQNAVRRVARVLHLYHPLFFGKEAVLTRAHIPILVGTSREMTGRVLRRLEAMRVVVRVGRDELRLLDAAGLDRLATSQPNRAVKRTELVPRQGEVSGAR